MEEGFAASASVEAQIAYRLEKLQCYEWRADRLTGDRPHRRGKGRGEGEKDLGEGRERADQLQLRSFQSSTAAASFFHLYFLYFLLKVFVEPVGLAEGLYDRAFLFLTTVPKTTSRGTRLNLRFACVSNKSEELMSLLPSDLSMARRHTTPQESFSTPRLSSTPISTATNLPLLPTTNDRSPSSTTPFLPPLSNDSRNLDRKSTRLNSSH